MKMLLWWLVSRECYGCCCFGSDDEVVIVVKYVVKSSHTLTLLLVDLFVVVILCVGSWVSRIPDVKDELNFNNTQLGFLLLTAAGGAITALPLSSILSEHFGSRKTLLIGILLLSVCLPLLGTSNVLLSFIGIFCIGKYLLIIITLYIYYYCLLWRQ